MKLTDIQKWPKDDLPPTTEQIMADPRVKALVEALSLAEAFYMRSSLGVPNDMLRRVTKARRAALAQIKEPTCKPALQVDKD
jgi:hypothetical protein